MQQIVNPAWSKERRRDLRHRQTQAEDLLWRQLRNRQCGNIKFRRQVGIGPYIADFYAHHEKLVVELDGLIHDSPEAKAYDAERGQYFKELGLTTLRFTNEQAFIVDSVVCKGILDWVTKKN